MRTFPSILAVLATCTALLGCCRPPPCLSGACPQVGFATPDEMFRLVRRELERSEAATPLVGAHILEKLPWLFPDVSNLRDEPRCRLDLVDAASAATFDETPVVFSRWLIGRIRAVGDLQSTRDVMDAKTVYLRRLAELDEARLSAYQFSPGESGPAPPKSYVRYAALSMLVGDGIPLHEAEALFRRLQTSTDDRMAWILHDKVMSYLGTAICRTPWHAIDDQAKGLFRSWLPDMQRRLQGPPDPLSLEIVLQRMLPLGVFSTKLGLTDDARKLLESVIAARGEFSLTRGIPGAARDLAVTAQFALFDLETPHASTSVRTRLPSPARKVFRPDEEWLRDPAPARPAAEAVAARMRDLDGELLELKFAYGRCHVLWEQARWVLPGDADRLFDRMVAPLSQGRKVAFSSEAFCRLRAATGLRAAPESKRVGLVLRWLRAGPADIAEWDPTGDNTHSMIGPDTDKRQVQTRAASVLSENIEWVEHHAELRAWLSEQAQRRNPSTGHAEHGYVWEELQPAYERLLAFHASGHPEASVELGRAILRTWIECARATLGAESDVASYDSALAQRLFALGDFAVRFGLRDEAQALFDDMAKRVVPRPAEDSPGLHLSLAHDATVASLLMSFTLPQK
ncbi:hypothetical protein [Polyangium mundeleinium]|uniref:DUF4034 domain-containing protein n=1 Tax=Polyangium mundeleinium TaxID=2995306 RepID=A0ABT5EIJ6_9BACT|nr:hypothetical protein [Polyangium mundeleinium]MDC0740575.1 hypothetical protein [Polyangium mundeleinium]